VKLLSIVLLLLCLSFGTLLAAPPVKEWIIMLYVMADNDLEESALADLEELALAKTGKNVQVVALVDRGSNYTQDGAANLKPWKGTKKLLAGDGTLKELANWGVTDMSNPATLTRFVGETVKEFPAKHYALIFWDHGGGWTGFGVDESADTGLTLKALNSGLSTALSKAAVPKLDILGFDACLMADYESMTLLQRFAQYYIASEELEPGHGWDWRVLAKLEAKPTMSAVDLGKLLIAGYMAQAAAEGSQDEVTLSMVDLTKLPKLDKAVADFAKVSQLNMKNLATDLGRSAGTTLAFGKAGSPEEDTHLVDLGELVRIAASESPLLVPSRDAVKAALKEVVIVNAAGKQFKSSSGVSIYFPNRSKLFDKGYASAGSAAWQGFLSSYYKAGTEAPVSRKPVFVAKENQGEVLFDEDGVTLYGTLAKGTADSVIDTTFYYGLVDEGITVFLGDQSADVDQTSGEVVATWDRTVLELSQGDKSTWGYLSLSSTEDGEMLFSVPFAYFKSGKVVGDNWDYVYIDMTINADGEITSLTLFKETDDGKLAELKPVRGSVIVPLLEVVDEEGESTMEMIEEWGFDARNWEDIAFDYSPIDSGFEVYLELSVYDSADNDDWLYWQGELE